MKIDGKAIASFIKDALKIKIASLRQKNITPHLAVVLIGNDPSSEVYVRQKKKVGEELGVKVTVYGLAESDKYTLGQTAVKTPQGWPKDSPGVEEYRKLINLVNKLNNDDSVHGIIIQRPVPIDISKEELDLLVIPQKDVDGFHPKSPFTPPLASAVLKILEWVYNNLTMKQFNNETMSLRSENNEKPENFKEWFKKQRVLVIGRGETAGKPIAETLKKFTDKITIAHSQTKNMKEVCLSSDIIITCVGRPYIVRRNMVTDKTFLIGVGLHQEDEKLATDYDQREIADKVAFHTPVPGGVGPVNVACLFENLIFAI